MALISQDLYNVGMYYFSKVKPEYYDSIKEYRDETLKIKSRFDGCNCLEDYEDIEKWDLFNKLFESADSVSPGYSIGFQYLYIDSNEVIGMVNFRPEAELHPYLSQYGGHIGYSVKPSKRGLGIGKQMLKDFLPIAKECGLSRVLITCMEYNDASRRIILANGGEFESKVIYPPEDAVLERYWIKL